MFATLSLVFYEVTMRDWGHPTWFLLNILSIYNAAHVPRTQLPLSFVYCCYSFLNRGDPLHLTVKHGHVKPQNCSPCQQTVWPWRGKFRLCQYNVSSLFWSVVPLFLTTATPLRWGHVSKVWLQSNYMISVVSCINILNTCYTVGKHVGIYRATRYSALCHKSREPSHKHECRNRKKPRVTKRKQSHTVFLLTCGD